MRQEQALTLRVSLAILFEQMGPVHFRVDLGGRQAGMAQKLLDHPEIRPVAQQMGGKGMAQRMGRCRIRQV